jgi:hypothetical protein
MRFIYCANIINCGDMLQYDYKNRRLIVIPNGVRDLKFPVLRKITGQH